MTSLFYGETTFNGDLSCWNVENVTRMRAMFYFTDAFNQPLNNWKVNSVTDMNSMFYWARAFNQPLNNWNVANVTDMGWMFASAEAFSQNLDCWDEYPNIACGTRTTSMDNMFRGSKVATDNNYPSWWDCSSTVTYTVTFDSRGGSAVAAQTVSSGNPVTRPDPAPTRDGYTLTNWYTDSAATAQCFNFGEAITQNLTLYAGWSRVTYTP